MTMKRMLLSRSLFAAFLLLLSLASCKKNTWTDDGSQVIQFKDERFLQAILENPRNAVDKNKDGQITINEAAWRR